MPRHMETNGTEKPVPARPESPVSRCGSKPEMKGCLAELAQPTDGLTRRRHQGTNLAGSTVAWQRMSARDSMVPIGPNGLLPAPEVQSGHSLGGMSKETATYSALSCCMLVTGLGCGFERGVKRVRQQTWDQLTLAAAWAGLSELGIPSCS